jgi:hypothetical protein
LWDSLLPLHWRLLCSCPTRQVCFGNLSDGIAANNLRNGKGVALAALKGMPLLLFANGFYFFLEFDLRGHQPQHTVNCTAAL